MRICVGIICGDCKKEIGGKKTNYGLDGHGRCAKCHKAHGAELYYMEEAIVIGDDRDFEEMAQSAGASLVDGTMGDVCDYDADREEVFMFVGSQKDLACLTIKMEDKEINKKNIAKVLKDYVFGKFSLKDAKRYSPA